MDIRDAATVLQQVADNFTTGYDGKMLDPRVLFLPCIGKLNPALDCVWQVAITSPKYQRMPDWVPLESQVKTAQSILKAIQHQITNKISDCPCGVSTLNAMPITSSILPNF